MTKPSSTTLEKDNDTSSSSDPSPNLGPSIRRKPQEDGFRIHAGHSIGCFKSLHDIDRPKVSEKLGFEAKEVLALKPKVLEAIASPKKAIRAPRASGSRRQVFSFEGLPMEVRSSYLFPIRSVSVPLSSSPCHSLSPCLSQSPSPSPETIPGCLGFWEAPMAPNDCGACRLKDPCRATAGSRVSQVQDQDRGKPAGGVP